MIILTFKTPDVFDIDEYMDDNHGDLDKESDSYFLIKDQVESAVAKYVSYGEYVSIEIDPETSVANVKESN